jgi:signal recognition particle receptor subunit beta
MRVYLSEYDGIVFLLDATDSKSFSKSKADLNSLLTDKAISNLKPILVLVQRPDPSGIANEEVLLQELCLEELIAKVLNCSATVNV